MADRYDPMDPRSAVYVRAQRAANEAERDLFREIEPKPEPGIGTLLRRALQGKADDLDEEI